MNKFRDWSSAGNPGYHWIIGLKIKSYYVTLPFWWRLNQEKAVLFSKNRSLFSKSWIMKMFRVRSSAGNPGCHWIIGLKIKSYYQTLPFWWRLNQEKALLCSKNGSLFSNPVYQSILWERWEHSQMQTIKYTRNTSIIEKVNPKMSITGFCCRHTIGSGDSTLVCQLNMGIDISTRAGPNIKNWCYGVGCIH